MSCEQKDGIRASFVAIKAKTFLTGAKIKKKSGTVLVQQRQGLRLVAELAGLGVELLCTLPFVCECFLLQASLQML